MNQKTWGVTKDGKTASLYTIENANGMKAVVSDFGALLVNLYVPNAKGEITDVVLGMDTLAQYEANHLYLGSTVGRSANRIGGAAFAIGGKTYQLAKNEGENNLHSCPGGYHERMWTAEEVECCCGDSIRFVLESPDGDQGYPGNLKISVTYTVTADNELKLTYDGICDADTVLNMTNHSYFNLGGHDCGTAMDQVLTIYSDQITETDAGSIPNGNYIDVKGTPMDFNTATVIGDRIDCDFEPLNLCGGYDHNYVLKNNGELGEAAKLYDPKSQRTMTVLTDLPGMQFYAGNFIDGKAIGKGGYAYRKRDGVCFESQYFPNAINIPSFKSPMLPAGEKYHTVTIYRFS